MEGKKLTRREKQVLDAIEQTGSVNLDVLMERTGLSKDNIQSLTVRLRDKGYDIRYAPRYTEVWDTRTHGRVKIGREEARVLEGLSVAGSDIDKIAAITGKPRRKIPPLVQQMRRKGLSIPDFPRGYERKGVWRTNSRGERVLLGQKRAAALDIIEKFGGFNQYVVAEEAGMTTRAARLHSANLRKRGFYFKRRPKMWKKYDELTAKMRRGEQLSPGEKVLLNIAKAQRPAEKRRMAGELGVLVSAEDARILRNQYNFVAERGISPELQAALDRIEAGARNPQRHPLPLGVVLPPKHASMLLKAVHRASEGRLTKTRSPRLDSNNEVKRFRLARERFGIRGEQRPSTVAQFKDKRTTEIVAGLLAINPQLTVEEVSALSGLTRHTAKNYMAGRGYHSTMRRKDEERVMEEIRAGIANKVPIREIAEGLGMKEKMVQYRMIKHDIPAYKLYPRKKIRNKVHEYDRLAKAIKERVDSMPPGEKAVGLDWPEVKQFRKLEKDPDLARYREERNRIADLYYNPHLSSEAVVRAAGMTNSGIMYRIRRAGLPTRTEIEFFRREISRRKSIAASLAAKRRKAQRVAF